MTKLHRGLQGLKQIEVECSDLMPVEVALARSTSLVG